MKIKKEPLLKALTNLLPLTTRRTTMPILNHFLLWTNGGTLFIRASDTECDATEVIAVGDNLPHAICVPASRFISLVNSGKDEIELTIKSSDLVFNSGVKATLPVLMGSEFPKEVSTDGTLVGINPADLSRAIRSVAWASDAKNPEVITTRVHVYAKENKIIAEAGDKKMMARCEIAAITAELDIAIPVHLAESVCSALDRKGAQIKVGNNNVTITHDEGSLTSVLAEGPSLPFHMVFNTLTKEVGKISPKPLAAALDLARSISDDPTFAAVELSFKSDSCGVKLVRNRVNFDTEVEGSGTGEPIWFSARMLSTGLKKMDGAAVVRMPENGHNIAGFFAGELTFAAAGLSKV